MHRTYIVIQVKRARPSWIILIALACQLLYTDTVYRPIVDTVNINDLVPEVRAEMLSLTADVRGIQWAAKHGIDWHLFKHSGLDWPTDR